MFVASNDNSMDQPGSDAPGSDQAGETGGGDTRTPTDNANNSVSRFLALGGALYRPPSGKGGFLGWGARESPEPRDTVADDDAAYEAAAEAHRLRMKRRTEEMVKAEAQAIMAELLASGTPYCDHRNAVYAHGLKAF